MPVAGAAGGAVFVALVALTALCLGRRRQSGGGRQPPLQPLPSQETSEYQKVSPMTPMLSPIAPNLPYQSMPSPNPYNHMPGQNQPPYNPSTSPNLPMSPPMSPSINPSMNPGGYYVSFLYFFSLPELERLIPLTFSFRTLRTRPHSHLQWVMVRVR